MRAHRWTVIATLYFMLVLVADLLARAHQDYTGLFALIPVLLALEWGPGVVVLGSIPLLALTATQIGYFDAEPDDSTAMRTSG